jgi:squalene cyclase
MDFPDELKANSANYVARLKSPIGIYLRREVFKEEARADTALKRNLHVKAIATQDKNGGWNQLFVETANHVWDLALLGYDAKDPAVKKGLDWILSIQDQKYSGYAGFFRSSNRRDSSLMRSTLYGEFGPGCTIFYQTTYAVHLLHMFGFDHDKPAQTTVKSYLQFWTPTWCSAWCTINVLRVLIEHPLSKESKQVQAGLERLAKLQTPTGAWKGFPFYHTFHALSRAKNATAGEQLQKATPAIIRRQNKDGSWGGKTRETDTFLVLDALKNGGFRLKP